MRVPLEATYPARVTRQQREALNRHRSGVVYMTGLSGAGKSTLAAMVEQHLHAQGMPPTCSTATNYDRA